MFYFLQELISPTFYDQLSRSKIPKAQKDTYDLTVFFVLLGSSSVKAEHKMLVKLTPDVKERFLKLVQRNLYFFAGERDC